MALIERKMSEREVGQFPISIGTSLGIESAVGIHPEITNVLRPPVLDYRLLMVNLKTLIRNIHGAVEGDFKKQITTKMMLDTLIAEMHIIEATINRYSEGLVNVLFYSTTHASLKRKFPYAILRQGTTDNQLQYSHLERDVLKELYKSSIALNITQFDVEFEGSFQDTMIITHQCIDLLSRSHFTKLVLLETHTGTIKNYLQWNTKLTKGKDLVRMPFCKFTLQVFGDNGNVFSPMSMALKEAVTTMSVNDNWTNVATQDRLIYSIKKITDPKLRSQLMMLL